MPRNESLRKLRDYSAVGAAAALAFIAYEAGVFKRGETPTTGPGLEAIYKRVALNIGQSALDRASLDYVPGSITQDPDNEGVANVVVQTTDGKTKYTILAQMHTNKTRQPLASTTFEVVVQEHYGLGEQIKNQVLIVDDSQIGVGETWDAIRTQYPPGDQAQASKTVIADTVGDKTNKAMAADTEGLAGIILNLPDFVPAAPPPADNEIISWTH